MSETTLGTARNGPSTATKGLSPMRTKPITGTCQTCGATFSRLWLSRGRPQKFCCHTCYTTSLRIDPAKKFWDRVTPTDGCWIWQGLRNDSGYGIVGTMGKMVTAHRLSWTIHNGPIPQGLNVLHRCDIRACVNPSHLFLGTTQDNVDDKVAKGRQALGEKHGMSKLSTTDVQQIRLLRSQGVSVRSLSRDFGVSATHIYRVVKGICRAVA